MVVDKSTQTKELNAYVTGIGPSARIVLWDTILRGMPENELLTVVGHEIGHYVLMHVYQGYALCMVALLIGLMAAGKWAPLLISKLPSRWGVRALNDLTIIPVVVLCTAPSAVLVSPVESSISRMFEHESDVFALKLTNDPISLANAFITLAKKDLVDPRPPEWIEFWFFSHPSLGKRIDFAVSSLPPKPRTEESNK
jgi:STE24 endopeptidase